MSYYNPPTKFMQFALHDVLGFAHEDLDRETTEAIFDEASKLARDVLAPLNVVGDHEGAVLSDAHVKTANGFKEAYTQYRDGGWNAVPFDPAYGGQGLPWAVAFPVQEMWQGANMSFGLCPLLNQGAVEAISIHGSQEQKDIYLEKLISGEWTGTMNLTEPQAGSDLGLIRSKAESQNNGTYRISGQKIFITYGEHGLADNIIHLVLARIEGAPEDVKGISLFIVPKILEDGTRNTVSCIGLEHKLGIHASPTCTMEFDGAIGYLIGAENQGLKCMFTMMNNARLSVGLQGVAIAEAAYQHALAYADERVQGKSYETGERVSIAQHADVRRMLTGMQARIMGGRLMTYAAALALDGAHNGDEGAQITVDILTPIVKAWCTDMAVDVASEGVQIHGGMGYIEETGAAQFLRDARILPIYEGTNGIQALDLVFRKTLRDGGVSVKAFIDQLLEVVPDMDVQPYFDKLLATIEMFVNTSKDGAAQALSKCEYVAVPFLQAFGTLAAYVYLLRAAEKVQSHEDQGFADQVIAAKDYYKAHLLPFVTAGLDSVQNGLSS